MRWTACAVGIPCSLIILLSGCSRGEHEDIKRWMDESSHDLRGNVAPLPELNIPPIVSYDPKGNSDPFSSARIEPEKVEGGGKKPDFNRPKEQLEAYSLDSLNYVGLLVNAKDGKRRALIKVDQVIHHVAVGSYIGENFGRIVEIGDAEVRLIETIQDPTGQTRDWVERETSLKLLEGSLGKEAQK